MTTKIIQQKYPNGQLKFLEKYKDSKLHGEVKFWYENGQLYTLENYKDGKLYGVYIKYYDNNIIKMGSCMECDNGGIITDN